VIERAQRGDVSAFNELVTQFQDLAVGTAYAWLGEIEAARDVSQEAFLEAHRALGQLREPAAFPGWFRRIVTKHCDRVTRRTTLDIASSGLPEQVGSDASMESDLVADRQKERLRMAVDALPPDERMLVALHYFAEATGNELSVFLELPLPTVKQRLRRARRRLREEGETMIQRTIDGMRPSKTEQFSREVSFFLALRAGDRAEVRRLLELEPELVEALQEWDSSLVHAGVLPFATRATPLITAIERNDLPMQTVLLEAGADPNGRCGCATGESPLWTAVLLNRLAHARKLLERGADPNLESASRNRPLHLAAMRGLEEMAALLLDHGADRGALDAGARYHAPWSPSLARAPLTKEARTAAQWAELNGHHALAMALSEAAPERSSDKPFAATSGEPMTVAPVVRTGIKALDLFAPVVRGGLIRLPFKAGVGMVVLLGELCQRFLATDTGSAIWTGFTQPPFDRNDWAADMAEFGLIDRVQSSLADIDEPPAARRAAFECGLAEAEALRDAGKDVLVIVLSTQGFENEVDANLIRLKQSSERGSITTIIVTPFPEQPDQWTTLKSPYTGQIVLDRIRAQRHLYPAIDPRSSLSQALDSTAMGDRHLLLARRARATIESYQQEDPDLSELDLATTRGSGTAYRLLRYFCQPFSITEPFTGRPGEYIALDELLDDVEGILSTE